MRCALSTLFDSIKSVQLFKAIDIECIILSLGFLHSPFITGIENPWYVGSANYNGYGDSVVSQNTKSK